MVPRREAPRPNETNNLCEKCGQQPPLISNENFQGRPHHPETGNGRDGPPQKAKGGVAGTTTAHQANTKSSVESLWGENNASERNATPQNMLDERLDDLISIADLTGATLDEVARTVGHLPEATFATTVDVLAALAAPPAPTDLQGLVQQHRTLTDRIVEAETDAGIAEIDAQIDQLEQRIMATPARSAAEAYAKILAIFPELWFDLQRPEYVALVAEIGGEV